MIQYVALSVLLLCLYVLYAYYLKPKAEIKRYKAIFRNLGYSVYEMEFSFFGISFVNDWLNGVKKYKDALHIESTVYPHVDISIGNVLDRVIIGLANPDLVKVFLSADMIYSYPKYQKLIQSVKLAFGQGGLAFSEGSDWKNKRKLMSKVFNFELLIKNIPKISAICDRAFDEFDAKFAIEDNKSKYDVLNVSAKIFNGVMMRCFFGSDQIDDEIKGLKYEEFLVKTTSEASILALSPLMVFMGRIAWKLGLTAQIRKAKDNVRLMRQKAIEIIKKRSEQVANAPLSSNCSDIIQALIYEKMANKEEFSYSDDDLVDEFQTFLLAGTDTTTHFFSMIIYYLGKYPQVQKKLREHINSIIKSDDDITYENLKKLTYIENIQQEVTRHYGPAVRIFERIASQDNIIKNIPISKGTVVNINQRGIHYSQKYFKDPMEFRPERWEGQCDGIHPFALGGFSAGPRGCIGKHLAMLESKIALVKFIRRYEKIEVPSEITKVVTLMYETEPFQTTLTKISKK